jgi:hypothetical protein
LGDEEAFRVRLFSLSLTSTAFAWYAALPPNSINSWNELESKFHEHFFVGEYELGLADLASVRQGHEESVNDYTGGSGTLETDTFGSMSQTKS